MRFTVLTLFFAIIISQIFVNPLPVAAQTGSFDPHELQPGTTIRVRMDNEINSEVSGPDDTFTVTVSEPVTVREVVVLPIGATIQGRVISARRAAAGGRNGRLKVVFERLTLEDGTRRSIEAVLAEELKARNKPAGRILTVLGGAALGALIGAVSGADNGALIGTGIGAGAGTGAAVLQKGTDVRIRADEVFDIRLTRSVILPAEGF